MASGKPHQFASFYVLCIYIYKMWPFRVSLHRPMWSVCQYHFFHKPHKVCLEILDDKFVRTSLLDRPACRVVYARAFDKSMVARRHCCHILPQCHWLIMFIASELLEFSNLIECIYIFVLVSDSPVSWLCLSISTFYWHIKWLRNNIIHTQPASHCVYAHKMKWLTPRYFV